MGKGTRLPSSDPAPSSGNSGSGSITTPTTPSGNSGPGSVVTAPTPSSPAPGSTTTIDAGTTSSATLTASISPAAIAAASQEDRGGIAGAQTAILTQVAGITARLDKIEAILAKLIGN